ncbi:hypothetical protein Gotri_021364, partial [Gossypium trilobum]|nr:hypothetical protein [Gossypium klotzschianum]MBA0758359.1 hypothetical protein [Gossypium trilobum]MBA0822271.1 hypothetical protein [Gossypium armourianum]
MCRWEGKHRNLRWHGYLMMKLC